MAPVTPGYAGAYEWGGLGSRAQSMGGAFIGLADDWTAIYWNPAGLTQHDDAGWGFEFFSPHPVIKDGSSLSNLLPTNMDTRYQIDTFAQYTGLEPTKFNKDEVRFHFYSPSGLGGCWQHNDFSMAAGFYVPVGYYFNWQDTISYGTGTINAKLFQELALIAGNLSIAKQIDPRLSLGASIELLYGKIDYEAKKVVANSGVSDYTWDYESDCDGIGIEGVFGSLFKVTNELTIGGVYRTGAKLDLQGDADTHLSLTGLAEESDFTQKFYHPSTWGLGLAYKYRPELTLTADWQRTNWSEFKVDVDFDTEGTAIQDRDYSADWNNSDRYRFGFEYRPNERWSIRGGYFFNESPLPDKSVSFSNIADPDRHNISVGLGHEWPNKWRLDAFYQYSWGDRQASGVDYSQRVSSFGVTLSHRF